MQGMVPRMQFQASPGATCTPVPLAGRCGSVLYMAPEVARGKPYNEKWVLGLRAFPSAALRPCLYLNE